MAASQIAMDDRNGLRFRIFGTKGVLEREQENSNFLRHFVKKQQEQLLTSNLPGNGENSTCYPKHG